MKIPRWAQVLIGVAIVGVFLGIGAIIAVTAYFSQNVVVNTADMRAADDEFEKIKQRFKGQEPLVEFKEGFSARRNERPAMGSRVQLTRLHILAWDSDEEKLANISIPFWVLRLKSGPIRFSTYTTGLDDRGVRLTPEEIEAAGPGIILEGTGPHGERFMLWAE
jgi:hypothetical protein